MRNRLRIFSLLIVTVSIMMFFLSCASSDDLGPEYLIEFVAFSSRPEVVGGDGMFKVVAYDSRSDSLQKVTRVLGDCIISIFCELEESKMRSGFIHPKETYPVLNNDEVFQLINKFSLSTAQIGQVLGPCYRDAGKKIQSLTCDVIGFMSKDSDDHDVEYLLQFYCLINEQTQEVLFVDSIVSPSGSYSSRPFKKGYFSSNGRFFYYKKNNVVKRFDIQSRVIVDFSEGSIPVIPWNKEGVAVYNEKEHLFKLLSKDGAVKLTVKQKIRPPIESVFAIDSTTFVCSSLAPPKAWHSPKEQEIYLIDFANGTSRKLIDRVSLLQILDAKRVK